MTAITDLRALITDHMRGLTGDDASAQGSIDFGDYLIDQLVALVEHHAIGGYRADLMTENVISYDADGSNCVWDYDGIGQMVVGEEETNV